jgi:hypothetical protein
MSLCEEMAKLIDQSSRDSSLVDIMGPATLKLSNALADYRDSSRAERHAPPTPA